MPANVKDMRLRYVDIITSEGLPTTSTRPDEEQLRPMDLCRQLARVHLGNGIIGPVALDSTSRAMNVARDAALF